MEFARQFWKCMFEIDKDEEFILTLFSTFDECVCVHSEELQEACVRDACKDCLRHFIDVIKNCRSMVRLHCFRNYGERERPGTRFNILFYPFTNKMCTTLDIMPDSMNSFLYNTLKENTFSHEQVDFTATEFIFNHCTFDEEIDIFDTKRKLRLCLLFRFFLLESLRSKNPIRQRQKIFQLMIENEIAHDSGPEEEELFCKTYDHTGMIEYQKQIIDTIK